MQLSPDTISRIEASFGTVRPKSDKLVNVFFDRLFQKAPFLRPMFAKDLPDQKKKLQAGLLAVVGGIRKPESLVAQLRDVGARQARAGVQETHYTLARDAMLDALASIAGPAWSPQLRQDWTQALDLITGLMLDGAHAAERKAA